MILESAWAIGAFPQTPVAASKPDNTEKFPCSACFSI